jgi:hypothetical protein
MVEEIEYWRRFYNSTRKEVLVYIAKEILSAFKLSSSCKKLEISKSRNSGKRL